MFFFSVRYLLITLHLTPCYFGVNLNPLCKPSQVSYTLIPTMCYYEFLPVNRSNNELAVSRPSPTSLNQAQHEELVELVDVKLGQEYELVVTTHAGEFYFLLEFKLYELS